MRKVAEKNLSQEREREREPKTMRDDRNKVMAVQFVFFIHECMYIVLANNNNGQVDMVLIHDADGFTFQSETPLRSRSNGDSSLASSHLTSPHLASRVSH